MSTRTVDDPAIVSWRLDNGLRVVEVPQPGTGVACVSVSYAVGFRDERPGETGFAHLFEHLMTQGSPHLDKLEHKALIEDTGGWYSGQTRHDYTGYMSTLPAADLELALWCEADRMSGVRLSRDNLDNQVSVVKQEIRGNIHSQPYGGFPCFQVDASLFETFANNHDGYGDFRDLDRATVEQAEEFFIRYYAPSNAVLAVAGDFGDTDVRALVARHFGHLQARSAPLRPDLHEPKPVGEKHVVLEDSIASVGAVALGYRAPDPLTERRRYLQLHLLHTLLTSGPDSVLWRAMVEQAQVASSVVSALGSVGDWQATTAPAQLAIGAHLLPGVTHAEAVAVFDDVVPALARVGDDEVRAVAAQLSTGFRRAMDSVYNAALYAGLCELLHGDARLIEEPPSVWLSSTAEELRAIAHGLRRQERVVVELKPAGS